MKIITIGSIWPYPHLTQPWIDRAIVVNDDDVTNEALTRIKIAAEKLGLNVDMRSPEGPDLASFIEDLEEDANEVEEAERQET